MRRAEAVSFSPPESLSRGRSLLDLLELKVLPRNYSSMLCDHFARLAYELDASLTRPSRPEEVEGWRRRVREALWDAMGVEPERAELNARVVRRRRKKGYGVENIVFESRPGFLVTGNLYLPEGEGPFPAILRVHGHSPRGKFQAEVQASAATLARAGFVVLAVDMVGYGDRWFQGHREGVWLPAIGMSLPGLLLWDNIRALDYLESRREVDPERIGVTGSSGGGTQTMYLAALDDRVKAAVPVVSAEVFEDQVASGRCYCECVPGIMRFANVSDVLALIAPRPLLLICGIHDDVFPVLRARKAYLRLKRIYEMMGVADRVALYEVHTGHGYFREMREAMYRWFNRWLRGEDEPIEERDLDLDSEYSPSLSCLPRPEGETIATLYYRKALELAKARRASPEEWIQRVGELRVRLIEDVFGGFPEELIHVRSLGKETLNGIEVEKLAIRTELDIIVPALLLRRSKEGGRRCRVYLSPRGKARAPSLGIVRSWLDAGYAVLALDYRGVGETAFSEEVAVKNSLVLGRHVLGMRVYDVIRAIDFLLGEAGFSEVELYGEREAGFIALLAAALEERVKAVHTLEMPATLVSRDGFSYPPSLFPPNILRYADVPELAAMVAPRPLAIEQPIGPHLELLPQEEADECFEFTRYVYECLGAPHNFSVISYASG
ncbi:MAG: acetylxylan esterase [Thermoproteales archaeon]|nr:acetylxylan esterase [Thermoproteales archaeon]